MKRSVRRSRLVLIFVAAVAGTVIVSHELTVSPRLQKQKVREAVAGFACPEMIVEMASGSQSRGSRFMRSGLRMPMSCLADLQRRIRLDTRFRANRCNIVEQCWTRTDGDRRYTFIFYPTHISFRFEQG